jgi:hypothetical protein
MYMNLGLSNFQARTNVGCVSGQTLRRILERKREVTEEQRKLLIFPVFLTSLKSIMGGGALEKKHRFIKHLSG